MPRLFVVCSLLFFSASALANELPSLASVRDRMISNEIQEASNLAQQIVEAGGKDAPLASYLIGEILYGQHQFEKAAEAFSLAKGLAISSYAKFYQAESLFWAHDVIAAKRLFESIIAYDKDSLFLPWARLRVADADFASGEYETASLEYKAFLRDYPAYSYPEAVAFSLAECARRTGNTKGAAEAYLALWISYPHSIHAKRSMEARLQMIEAGATFAAPSYLQRLERASNLRGQRFHEQAMLELDILRKEVINTNFSGDSTLVSSIDLERGLCFLRLGKMSEAESTLALVSKSSKNALRYLSDAQAMNGKPSDAKASFEAYADITDANRKKTKSRAYADFLFDIGLYKDARAEYSKLSKDSDVTFRLAWCDYRNDNYSDASGAFEKIQKRGGEYKPTAGYWLARIQDKLGKTKEAKAAYQAIIDEDDTSYYAVLSRSRLALLGERKEAPLGPEDVSNTTHIKDSRPKPSEVEAAFKDILATKDIPALARAYDFYRIGLDANGREELEAGYLEVKSGKGAAFKSRSPYFPANWSRKSKLNEELILADATPELSKGVTKIQGNEAAPLLEGDGLSGATKEGTNTAELKLSKEITLKTEPNKTPNSLRKDIGVAFSAMGDAHYPMYLLSNTGAKRYYPQAYPAVVIPVAQEFMHTPEELWSLMHTESLFHRFVASTVGAIGLMQIMPRTGRAIGDRLGFDDFRPGTLFDANINLSFAGWYYRKLKDTFHNQLPLAMAAYNGGPYMVGRIVRSKAHTKPTLDEIVEEIPPRQSRLYAKKVLHKVSNYQKLYKGSTALTIDLTLNSDVDPKVDF
jgi:soluble lytic murein transglycosylase